MPNGEEERQARREAVHGEPAGERGADVFPPVREGEGQLLHEVRPGLLHMVAGDGDAVELGHRGGGVAMMSATIRIEGSGGYT
jgi:hypothetical protein